MHTEEHHLESESEYSNVIHVDDASETESNYTDMISQQIK